MNNASEIELVVDYIFEDLGTRLPTAITIFESYRQIKRRVLIDFDSRLVADLKSHLDPSHQIISTLGQYPHNYWPELRIINDGWATKRWVALKGRKGDLGNVVFAIVKPQDKAPSISGLLNHLNGTFAQGWQDDKHDYLSPCHDAENWDKEVLVRLMDPKTSTRLGKRLVELIEMAEKYL